MPKRLLPVFSCRILMVSCHTFRSFIHFVFIFVYGIRKWSSFILLHVAVQFPNTTGWGDFLSICYSFLLCWRLVDHIVVGLFLGFLLLLPFLCESPRFIRFPYSQNVLLPLIHRYVLFSSPWPHRFIFTSFRRVSAGNRDDEYSCCLRRVWTAISPPTLCKITLRTKQNNICKSALQTFRCQTNVIYYHLVPWWIFLSRYFCQNGHFSKGSHPSNHNP